MDISFILLKWDGVISLIQLSVNISFILFQSYRTSYMISLSCVDVSFIPLELEGFVSPLQRSVNIGVFILFKNYVSFSVSSCVNTSFILLELEGVISPF